MSKISHLSQHNQQQHNIEKFNIFLEFFNLFIFTHSQLFSRNFSHVRTYNADTFPSDHMCVYVCISIPYAMVICSLTNLTSNDNHTCTMNIEREHSFSRSLRFGCSSDSHIRHAAVITWAWFSLLRNILCTDKMHIKSFDLYTYYIQSLTTFTNKCKQCHWERQQRENKNRLQLLCIYTEKSE